MGSCLDSGTSYFFLISVKRVAHVQNRSGSRQGSDHMERNNIFFLNIFFFSPSKCPEINGQNTSYHCTWKESQLACSSGCCVDITAERINTSDYYRVNWPSIQPWSHMFTLHTVWGISLVCLTHWGEQISPHRIVLCGIWVVSLMLPLCNIGEKGPCFRKNKEGMIFISCEFDKTSANDHKIQGFICKREDGNTW